MDQPGEEPNGSRICEVLLIIKRGQDREPSQALLRYPENGTNTGEVEMIERVQGSLYIKRDNGVISIAYNQQAVPAMQIVNSNSNELGPRQLGIPGLRLAPTTKLVPSNGTAECRATVEVPFIRYSCLCCQLEFEGKAAKKRHFTSMEHKEKKGENPFDVIETTGPLSWADGHKGGQQTKKHKNTVDEDAAAEARGAVNHDEDRAATLHVENVCATVVTHDVSVDLKVKTEGDVTIKQVAIPHLYESVTTITNHQPESTPYLRVYKFSIKVKQGGTKDLGFKLELNKDKKGHHSCLLPIIITWEQGKRIGRQTLHLYCRSHEATPKIHLDKFCQTQVAWPSPPSTTGKSNLHSEGWLKDHPLTPAQSRAIWNMANSRTSRDPEVQEAMQKFHGLLKRPTTAYNYLQKMELAVRLTEAGNESGELLDIKMEKVEGLQYRVHMNPFQAAKLQLKPPDVVQVQLPGGSFHKMNLVKEEKGGFCFRFKASEDLGGGGQINMRKATSSHSAQIKIQAIKEGQTGVQHIYPDANAAADSFGIAVHQPEENQDLSIIQQGLTEEQSVMVRKALAADRKYPFIVHGPPGVGKSQLGREILLQAVKKGEKVLWTAPTNVGIDDTVAKIKTTLEGHAPGKTVRRLSQGSHSSEMCNELCFTNEEGEHYLPDPETLAQVDVVVSTVGTAGRLGWTKTGACKFGLILIDEAAFMPEADVLPTILPFYNNGMSPHIVLMGDVNQVSQPPSCRLIQESGLGVNIVERLLKSQLYQSSGRNWGMLTLNFRNPPVIVDLLNEIKYKHLIANRTDHMGPNMFGACHVEGSEQRLGHSRVNVPEAYAVINAVANLVEKGNTGKVCIITHYASHKVALEVLAEDRNLPVTVRSTESAQGAEADMVILSPSPRYHAVTMAASSNWLASPARALVALSRARRSFWVVGNLLALASVRPYNIILKRMAQVGTLEISPKLRPVLMERVNQHS